MQSTGTIQTIMEHKTTVQHIRFILCTGFYICTLKSIYQNWLLFLTIRSIMDGVMGSTSG